MDSNHVKRTLDKMTPTTLRQCLREILSCLHGEDKNALWATLYDWGLQGETKCPTESVSDDTAEVKPESDGTPTGEPSDSTEDLGCNHLDFMRCVGRMLAEILGR